LGWANRLGTVPTGMGFEPDLGGAIEDAKGSFESGLGLSQVGTQGNGTARSVHCSSHARVAWSAGKIENT
jgi:hypothetical protein